MNILNRPILALSTAWNFQRHHSGHSLLEEIAQLGFHWVELHRELDPSLKIEMLQIIEKGKIRISSLRNYCFSPSNKTSEGPQFTGEEDERRLAVRWTQQSIDHAVQFRANYVILNCGSTNDTKSYPLLRALASQRKLYTKQFAREKIKKILEREKESHFLKNRVLSCLRELGDYAGERGIRLGIENQKDYSSFPTEREFPILLKELNHSAFGYWHHFGHAQIKHHLTFINHQQWLERIGFQAIGCTIDDIQGLDYKYLPPFTGVIPYDKLMPFLSQSEVFVLNLKGFSNKQAILKSVARWESTFSLS